jgi:preprotein translocase subunit SecE
VNTNYYIKLAVVVAAIAISFGLLWRKGQILRLRNYISETREELRKCTWPSWEELRGSTVVVMVSILLLAVFTISIDLVLATFVNWVAQI